MSLTPNQDLMVEGIMSLENEMYVHFRNESFIRLQIFPEILTEKGFQTVTRYLALIQSNSDYESARQSQSHFKASVWSSIWACYTGRASIPMNLTFH